MRRAVGRRTSALAATAVAAWVLGGCSGSDASRTTRLEVYAASSLTEAFTDLEGAYEAAHPDVDVRVTFAGSQVLRLQIEQGAPAEVFASADPDHVDALVAEGLVSHPVTFAYNELVVIVPVSNPTSIDSFEQLPTAERIVLGTENVPVGRYAREVLRRATDELGGDFGARVLDRVASEETNVRLARSKVELGEADAAIVYRTDARASDRVLIVAIPREINVRAEYVMGLVRSAKGGTPGDGAEDAAGEVAAAAEAWIDFVRSPSGARVLTSYGFGVR